MDELTDREKFLFKTAMMFITASIDWVNFNIDEDKRIRDGELKGLYTKIMKGKL